jgi:hypothetical protein
MHAISAPRVRTIHTLVATTRNLVDTLVDTSPKLFSGYFLPKLVDAEVHRHI